MSWIHLKYKEIAALVEEKRQYNESGKYKQAKRFVVYRGINDIVCMFEHFTIILRSSLTAFACFCRSFSASDPETSVTAFFCRVTRVFSIRNLFVPNSAKLMSTKKEWLNSFNCLAATCSHELWTFVRLEFCI